MINYSFLRPQKALALRKFYESQFQKKEKLSTESYYNATILPLQKFEGDSLLFGRGGVVTSQGIYIDSSAILNRVQGTYEYKIQERINKKVVYCGFFTKQWGHFLIESVSRLWYFLENDPTIDYYVFFLKKDEEANISGNYKEFFKLLGIWNKLKFINKPTQFREIIIPELSYSRQIYYSEYYKQIFKKISQVATSSKKKTSPSRIYFSRSKIKNIEKKEFGLDVLDSYFQNNGYKIIYPEQLTLSELIAYIDGADEIATLSGSIHHNLLFAQDNKRVLLLERTVLNNEIQVDINRMKLFETTYIDANIPIYPVNVGSGPFIIASNEFIEQFTTCQNFIPIEKKYQSSKYLKKLFKQYIICYYSTYGFKWCMEDWMIKYIDCLKEGYNAGMKYFGKYISNYTIFNIILSPLYWKSAILKATIKFIRTFFK